MACIISLINPQKNVIIKTLTVYDNYIKAENKTKQLNEKINKKPNNKGLFWKITTIGV